MFEFIIGGIKQKDIFIGNVKKATIIVINSYFGSNGYNDSTHVIESNLYKKDAILVKIKDDCYVDIEKLDNLLNLLQIRKDINKDNSKLDNLILNTLPNKVNKLYIEKTSLKPYYNENCNKNVKIKEFKKTIKSNL